jgi:hypothetical protein
MKTYGFVKLGLCAVAVLIVVACSKGNEGDALYKQAETPDNLKGLLDTLVKASEGGDVKKAATLTRNLIPDEAAYKKALKDDAGALVTEMAAAAKQLPSDDAALAKLMRRGEADRTEIQVHGATTEEIAAGGATAKEFPGGAVDAAKSVLRPGLKFYEVEFVKPGEDMGMKYHLFFWDGARWKMLGPVWRSLRGKS